MLHNPDIMKTGGILTKAFFPHMWYIHSSKAVQSNTAGKQQFISNTTCFAHFSHTPGSRLRMGTFLSQLD